MQDADNGPPHQSVLLKECIELLSPKPGQCVVDCTLGAGGHSAAIIEKIAPGGRLIGFDADPSALEIGGARLEPLAKSANVALTLVHDNFSAIAEALKEINTPAPHGILADLGLSSMQLDQAERGFSFRFDHPLDMRMDPRLPESAADLLQTRGEEEIARIIYEYGEEHKSRRIARAIVEQRRREPIRTTGQLEELVRRALRIRGHRRIHPATKTFQALRIAVNRELENLEKFLNDAPELLANDGTLAVISFHSLEDRMVKHRLKALAETGRFYQLAKLVRPGADEERDNPRSRSAKLRAIRRVSQEHVERTALDSSWNSRMRGAAVGSRRPAAD